MALTPQVISSHFPYLPIRLTIGERTEEVEALLDTGFDGDVVVPSGSVIADRAPDAYIQWSLADGSTVRAPAYLGTAQVGDFGPFAVIMTILGDEPIIGRSLTDRFAITLDHGQRIVVEM